MAHSDDEYSQYVEHPQYGRGPGYTGLNPMPYEDVVTLHWHSIKRIPNTAIAADLARQSAATAPITHYFDVERVCRDCRRPFIFFAEEQRHWYEDLRRPIGSDGVRCMPCRDRKRSISLTQQRYDELFHIRNRTPDEDLALADCCLLLIEYSVFSRKQLQRVRTILDQLQADASESMATRSRELMERVLSIDHEINRKTLCHRG